MMQRWSGQNYTGARFDNYFVCYTHNRDSGTLDTSNFRSILKYLKKHKVAHKVVRFNHFAVGWIEQILISSKNKKAVDIGNEISDKLEGYPVFSDDDFSDLEWEKAEEILEEINRDIDNLDDGEELRGWNGITRDMTSEQILDAIMDRGMVDL